jgi:hypothetical protein
MRRRNSINPESPVHRSFLRTLGALLAVAGGVFMAIGLVSFFSAFGSHGSPELFWCVFVGAPLLAIGLALLKFGYMGAIARYAAGEIAPVATDSFDYVARRSRRGVRDLTSAIADGLTGDRAAEPCPACGADNDAAARFCDQCGERFAVERACPACGVDNDPGARFCDACGQSLGARKSS